MDYVVAEQILGLPRAGWRHCRQHHRRIWISDLQSAQQSRGSLNFADRDCVNPDAASVQIAVEISETLADPPTIFRVADTAPPKMAEHNGRQQVGNKCVSEAQQNNDG